MFRVLTSVAAENAGYLLAACAVSLVVAVAAIALCRRRHDKGRLLALTLNNMTQGGGAV